MEYWTIMWVTIMGTAHSRDEANEIHVTRRLPAEYEVVA